MKKTLSVIVPAYNEEDNLEDSIKSVLRIVPKYCTDYEVIIINDGSKDRTTEIANRLAKSVKIRALHNKKNRGMGYSYWRGVANAKFQYTMLVWGDYAHTDSSLEKILSSMGKYEVVIPYYINMQSRSPQRRVISLLFNKVVNLIAGLQIKYYNGSTLYAMSYLKNMPRHSSGFGYQAEVLAYVIRQGVSYIEVAVKRRNIPDGTSAAFKLKNILDVLNSLFWMVKEFRILSLRKLLEKNTKYAQ